MDRLSLAAEVVNACRSKGLKLSFAESCTGGLCAASIVSVAGASEVFYGSIVSYDNSVKEKLLSVPSDILESVGAVSEECAFAMANGAREQMQTDIAVSVTGIAGPGGGTAQKPVGLVYVGVSSARGTFVKKLMLSECGDRTAIRERSVCEMLCLVLEEVEKINLP